MIHELYTEKLLAMKRADQKMRIDYKLKLAEWDPYLDILHTEKLKEIIDDIGWPTISKVGKEASEAAWVIVQHAMDDKSFMEQSLDMMKAAGDDIERWEIAYLTDRLLMMDGKPQIYGTQYKSNKLWPVENYETLNERRAEMGLGESEGDVWLGE